MTAGRKDPAPTDWRSLYREADDLETRVLLLRNRHELLSPSPEEIARIVDVSDGERALDLGCGIGISLLPIGPSLVEAPDLFGTDLSLAVLAAAQRNVHRLGWSPRLSNSSAETLPFRTASFDVVLARHMLYHVDDIEAALREVRRVLRRAGGRLVATTNSSSSRPELTDCHERAVRRLDGLRLVGRGSARFGSENGKAVLESHFESVEELPWRGQTVFTETHDAVAYYLSTPYFQKASPDPALRRKLRQAVEREIQAVVAREGAFRLTTWGSIYVATFQT